MSNSASGDDEELKEALKELDHYTIHGPNESNAWEDCYGQHDPKQCNCGLTKAVAAVESLFGRIKEERDRATEKADMWLAASVSWEQDAFEARAELGRIREAALTPEEATSLDEFLRGIVSPRWEDRQFVANIRAKLRSSAGPPDKKEQ